MKWRIFQNKKVNLLFIADLFAQVSIGLDRNFFKKLKPIVLIIYKNKKVEWNFEQKYWKAMEHFARITLEKADNHFLEEARERINNTFEVFSSGYNCINSEDKLNIIVESTKDILGIFLGPFESILPELIRKELSMNINELEVSRAISILTQPEDFSFKRSFDLQLLQTAKEIKEKYPGNLNSKKTFKQNYHIKQLVKKLYLKYFTLPIDVSGQPWNEEYFWTKIYKIINENTIEQIKNKIAKLRDNLIKLKKQKKLLFNRYKASKKLIFLSKIAGEMALLRDYRKSLISCLIFYLYGFINDVLKEKNISFNCLCYYTINDIKNLVKKDKHISADEIKLRSEAFYILIQNKKMQYLSGINNEKLIISETNSQQLKSKNTTNIKLIKGVVGSAGKTVKGIARLIFTQDDLYKIKKNDILIAVATNYDLVPGMEKAKAIVTDEGGILSHAAVVSRELKVPCVIGTQIATKVINDGDLIEVNANEGIVKILKQ